MTVWTAPSIASLRGDNTLPLQKIFKSLTEELQRRDISLATSLGLKANIASPALTGTPSAPTATAGTSTTQLATTAFVTTADNLKADLTGASFSGAITATQIRTSSPTTKDQMQLEPSNTGTSGFNITLRPATLTGSRAVTFKDGSGTVAYTSDIDAAVPLAWISYTPTLIQGVAIAKTVNYAKYVKIQKTVFLQVMLTCTGGGLGGTVSVSFPSGLAPVYIHAQRVIGTFFIHDSGTALYSGLAMGSSPITGYGYGSNNNMGANTPAMTLVAGDQISIAVQYEVA